MADARLFLALWPDDLVRAALAYWRDAWTWPRGATPVANDKLHLTLHFLGEVPEARLPALVEGFALPAPRFQLDFGVPAVWHQNIAVLEPLTVPSELLDLQTALGARVAALGLPLEDRPYRPHVTMARRARGAQPPAANLHIRWPVDRYALVRSHPATGAYKVLHDWIAEP
ncbi:MAG: RNA 2',3'-cyclic phosphodiesterase [Telluria sp.]